MAEDKKNLGWRLPEVEPEEMPRDALPRGPVRRISKLMQLWHESPDRAKRFIDPERAKAMWGESKAQGEIESAAARDEEELKELWLATPERAMRFIDPAEALKKYGAPVAMSRARLMHLKLLYSKLHEHFPDED